MRRELGSLVCTEIVDEVNVREKCIPIFLELVIVDCDHGCQRFVEIFCLSISLRIPCCSVDFLDSK
jgi:hypothetical protein